MRIVLFTNLLPAFAALSQLQAEGWLKAVIATDELHGQNLQLKEICTNNNIKFLQVGKSGMLTDVKQLLTDIQADMAIVFGFTYRIPPGIYQLPLHGCYNIHFSLLPAYRGPDPVFQQIKNGGQMGGISIHKVDRDFDTGAVVMQQPVPFIPGETWGICFNRYIPAAAGMVLELIRRKKGNYLLQETMQQELQATYHPRITAADITINWDLQTAEQIDNLVNACNPAAGGAITFFKQQPVRILEVSQADGQSGNDARPGTIVYAGMEGLFVQCLNQQLLRVNILSLTEGVITGAKFVALGVRQGDRFEAYEVMHPTYIN